MGPRKAPGRGGGGKTGRERQAAAAPGIGAPPASAPAPPPATAQDSPEQALLILLQRSFQLRSDQATICALLAASKATAAAVAAACGGQLAIDIVPKGSRYEDSADAAAACCAPLEAWLQRNGGLLRSLSCSYDWRPHCYLDARVKAVVPTLLPALARSAPQLVELSLPVDLSAFNAASRAATAAQMRDTASQLAALRSLQRVTLDIRSAEQHGGPGAFLAGLQRLPELAHCTLNIVGSGPGFLHINKAGLDRLPAHLHTLGLSVRLGLHDDGAEIVESECGLGEIMDYGGIDTPNGGSCYPSTPQPPMLLGHLTALQELKPAETRISLSELGIRAGDVLPPALTALVLDADSRSLQMCLTGPLGAPTVGPLLALTRLQTLTISSSRASTAQLQQLGAALSPPHGALREVSLRYKHHSFAKGAAAGWPSLPLVSLSATEYSLYQFQDLDDDQSVPPGMLASLAQLTKLTSLRFTDKLAWQASGAEVARVLASMKSLQTLVVSGDLKPPAGQEADAGLDEELIASALASLPQLANVAIGLPCSTALLSAMRPDIKHSAHVPYW